jgi:cysteine-rich repeat protein
MIPRVLVRRAPCILVASFAAFACTDELPAPPQPTGLSIDPNQGENSHPTPVLLKGDFVYAVVSVDLDSPESSTIAQRMTAKLGDFPLTDLNVSPKGGVSAVVPASMPPGKYDLTIVDAGGRSATLAQAFTVVEPPPICPSSDKRCPVITNCPGGKAPDNCGDGVLQRMMGEVCDDGNQVEHDGCSPCCEVEPGFQCFSSPSLCAKEGAIAWVADRPSRCPGTGTMADPYCRVQLGVDDGKPFVAIATGHYGESVVIDGKERALVATEPNVTISGGSLALDVKGGSNVLAVGLTLKSSGDAISLTASGTKLSLSECEIGPSNGVGVGVGEGTRVAIDRTMVRQNGRGGIVIATGDYRVTNTIIASNGAMQGNTLGGVVLLATSSTAVFANDTIVENAAVIMGNNTSVGLTCAVPASVVNSIVWHSDHGGDSSLGGVCAVSYSIVRGGMGDSVIDADPQFTGSNFEVSETSPAIDAGDPRGIMPFGPAPPRDFAFERRPKGRRVDIGAYEVK